MSEPDWSKAPEWAQWVAMDADGDWWWFATKPTLDNCGTWYIERGNHQPVTLDYEPVCQPRPTTEDER